MVTATRPRKRAGAHAEPNETRPRLAEDTTEETAVHETNGHAEQADEGSHTISNEELSKLPAAESPAADPIPPPTPQELRYQHYQEIVAESALVEEARSDYEQAAAETKRLKKEYEGRQALFLRLTRRDPLQRTLLNAMPDPNLEKTNAAPVNDEWRKLPVSVLGATEAKNDKLGECHIHTLGDMQDHWKAGKQLSDCKGIGETTDAELRDRFNEYGIDHPEVFGQAPPAAGAVEPTEDAGEIDPDEPDADESEE